MTARILVRTVLLAIGLSIVFFGLAHLVPGGICSLYPDQPGASCAASLDLQSNPPAQYFHWAGIYLHGNFGQSPDGSNVASRVLGGIPASALILLGGLVVYLVGAALRLLLMQRIGRESTTRMWMWPVLVAAPLFWLALVLIYVLGIHWRILPTGHIDDRNIPALWSNGWFSQLGSAPVMILTNLLKHLVLPSIMFALVILVADRVSRRMLVTVRQGVGGHTGMTRSATRNLPLFASLLISGLVIVESVFSYSGLGYGLSSSLVTSPPDYAMTLDLLMLASGVLLLTKLAADWIAATRSGPLEGAS